MNLHRANQANNEKIVNQFHDALNDLRNAINKVTIPENANPVKVINILEKILDLPKK